MLSKENRLKKKRDFEAVFRSGKGFKQDFLFLKVFKNNLDVSRFGFVVGKKISKKTTLRNKIKRRMREIIKMNLPGIKKGWDGIIIANRGIENKGFKEIKESMERLLKKAELINK